MKSAPRRAVVGFLAGVAIWLALAPVYNPMLAMVAGSLIRLAEHPNVTSLEVMGNDVLIRRVDFDPRSPLPQIALSDLTFNFVVLTTLFGFAGLERKGNRDTRLLLAFALLLVGHVVGVLAKVMSIFVMQLGPWSKVHYGPVTRNFWATLYHFYRFVGAYAIAFAIWWWLGWNQPELAVRRAKKK